MAKEKTIHTGANLVGPDAVLLRRLQQHLTSDRGGPVTLSETIRYAIRCTAKEKKIVAKS